MTDDQPQSRFPNLGKLSLAILEHLVEPVVGKEAKDEIKAPLVERELKASLAKTLEETERVFIIEHDDADVREAVVNLPLANLPSILQAVRTFYSRPNDLSLGKVLRDQLKVSYPTVPSERLESGVTHYLAILRDELVNLPGDIREKLQAQAVLHVADTLDRIEKIYLSGSKIVVALDIGLGGKEYPRPREHVKFRAANFVGRKEELEKLILLLKKVG
ncbi:MAG: hypothetical protein MN733_21350, partial [Nitrososphaera sp.]|nr:hypothetical protein [Nitrososphaera sp.]